jgi:tRNA A-37 threonylcarbamoyl transferase component Bud32
VKICPVCTQAFAAGETRCPTDGVALVSLETGAGAGPKAADLTGEVIDGRYKVESVIGRGGMGLVYACKHVVVGKRVAMKVLKPGIERTEDILARFIREAQAANAVRSPHIAESLDFGQLPSGHFYVTMELLEGRSLAAALKERALSRDQLLYVFTQIADTLYQTHQAGIIHRDLKPDNVYLVQDPAASDPSGSPLFVKILDFGVAKILNSDDAGLTQSGVILGTPYYMAPEQARGLPIDHRVDIYSLGVMMYHAFTGRLPFIADSAVAVLTAHALDPPPPPSHVSSIDPGIERMILQCMEKQPAARYRDMHELAEGLRALRRLGGQAGLPPAPSGAYPRVDTQSGASLSGPHPSIATRVSAATAAHSRPTAGGIAVLVGGIAMLVLGGLAAAVLLIQRGPSGAAGVATSAAATAERGEAPARADAVPPSSQPAAPAAVAASASASPSAVASAATDSSATAAKTGAMPQGGWRPPPASSTPQVGSKYSPEIRNPFDKDEKK